MSQKLEEKQKEINELKKSSKKEPSIDGDGENIDGTERDE